MANVTCLKDLVGEHLLTGVDYGSESVSDGWMDSANYIVFELDGVTYKVAEDPDDGYRSYAKGLDVVDARPKNVFTPCAVVARSICEGAEILELVDRVTDEVVLRVGTENTDDYYPYYVAEFTPENMAINAGK